MNSNVCGSVCAIEFLIDRNRSESSFSWFSNLSVSKTSDRISFFETSTNATLTLEKTSSIKICFPFGFCVGQLIERKTSRKSFAFCLSSFSNSLSRKRMSYFFRRSLNQHNFVRKRIGRNHLPDIGSRCLAQNHEWLKNLNLQQMSPLWTAKLVSLQNMGHEAFHRDPTKFFCVWFCQCSLWFCALQSNHD